jgi:hypothetical protein
VPELTLPTPLVAEVCVLAPGVGCIALDQRSVPVDNPSPRLVVRAVPGGREGGWCSEGPLRPAQGLCRSYALRARARGLLLARLPDHGVGVPIREKRISLARVIALFPMTAFTQPSACTSASKPRRRSSVGPR